MSGAIAEGVGEFEHDPTGGVDREALEGDGWACDLTGKALGPVALDGRAGDRCPLNGKGGEQETLQVGGEPAGKRLRRGGAWQRGRAQGEGALSGAGTSAIR